MLDLGPFSSEGGNIVAKGNLKTFLNQFPYCKIFEQIIKY